MNKFEMDDGMPKKAAFNDIDNHFNKGNTCMATIPSIYVFGSCPLISRN